MAEARIEDEEEVLGASRDPRVRRHPRQNASAERPERNKPEQRQSGQGALSSIRAAIKRTSVRTGVHSDQRDRRRPEITVLSAEPLVPNSWFPGASGGFPPPPPPAPPSWSAGMPPTIQLPPPSYEQVLREKSREQDLHSSVPSLASQRSISTIATQTDTHSAGPKSTGQGPTGGSMARRPSKPPRPSLPLTRAPAEAADTQSLIELDEPRLPIGTHTQTNTLQSELNSDILTSPLSEPCGAQMDPWSGDSINSPPNNPTLIDSALASHSSPSPCAVEEVPKRPKPRPRSKANLQPITREQSAQNSDHPITREVKVQTLVRLKDDGTENLFAGFSDNSDVSPNKYLQDLLEVFGSDDQCYQGDQGGRGNQIETSEEEEQDDEEEAEDMPFQPAVLPNSESTETESKELCSEPVAQPRTLQPKPVLAPKPSIKEIGKLTTGLNQELSPAGETMKGPVPAPRPPPPRKSIASPQNVPEGRQMETTPLPRPSRPPPAARLGCLSPQTRDSVPGQQTAALPVRHSTDMSKSSPIGNSSSDALLQTGTSKLAHFRESSPGRRKSDGQSGTVKPLAASVKPTPVTSAPSDSGKRSPGLSRLTPPPPLPANQKKTPPLSRASPQFPAGRGNSPLPSLPARPSDGRFLPLRPPPIKLTKPAGSLPTSAVASQVPSQRTPKKGPPLPPRPKPGHPCFKIYPIEVIHGPKETRKQTQMSKESKVCSLQEKDILLLEDIQTHKPAQTDIQSSQSPSEKLSGQSQVSPVKVMTPEPDDLSEPTNQLKSDLAADKEQKEKEQKTGKCVARFKFEGEEEELSFSEGDVIMLTEYVNEEWGRGSLNGHSGIFPLNFVQIVEDLPPLPGEPLESSESPGSVGKQARALFDFSPESDDELLLKVGDIVCALEEVNDEWFCGVFGGKRGLVPKSYVQVLQDP